MFNRQYSSGPLHLPCDPVCPGGPGGPGGPAKKVSEIQSKVHQMPCKDTRGQCVCVKLVFFYQPDVGTKLPGAPFSPGGPGSPIPVRTQIGLRWRKTVLF